MVFCAYAEKLFWEGDGKHPHPQSTVNYEWDLTPSLINIWEYATNILYIYTCTHEVAYHVKMSIIMI